jgi:transcription antitermination factor NusG
MPTDSLSWYALHIKSNFERVAATILEGKNLEVYLPTYRRRRRWSDRTKEIDCPLFPGYVFCRFDVNSRLPILTTSGVLSIVGNGRTPAPIAEPEIEAVQAVTKSGRISMPWPFLRTGQRVVIRKGALAGLEGILLSSPNRYRIVISINLLQRSIATEIDADMVCPTQARFAPQPSPVAAI